jgi:hypothetical protein
VDLGLFGSISTRRRLGRARIVTITFGRRWRSFLRGFDDAFITTAKVASFQELARHGFEAFNIELTGCS